MFFCFFFFGIHIQGVLELTSHFQCKSHTKLSVSSGTFYTFFFTDFNICTTKLIFRTYVVRLMVFKIPNGENNLRKLQKLIDQKKKKT